VARFKIPTLVPFDLIADPFDRPGIFCSPDMTSGDGSWFKKVSQFRNLSIFSVFYLSQWLIFTKET
jgi:hypothetical protein